MSTKKISQKCAPRKLSTTEARFQKNKARRAKRQTPAPIAVEPKPPTPLMTAELYKRIVSGEKANVPDDRYNGIQEAIGDEFVSEHGWTLNAIAYDLCGKDAIDRESRRAGWAHLDAQELGKVNPQRGLDMALRALEDLAVNLGEIDRYVQAERETAERIRVALLAAQFDTNGV